MKKVLLAIALATGAGNALALSGNDLLEYARAREGNLEISINVLRGGVWIGFIHGTAATLMEIDPRVCLPTGSTNGQWAAVVKQYLEQNPAQLHRPAHNLVREALQRAFPCR